ncbi:MAG: ATP phosphoribosyltransferase regulatory subunit, partial [Sphingomonadaceae bacterium]|nr:ATP phosphoribosyltransferase regulatory subunit [Sphingomonadaceae bacterium]
IVEVVVDALAAAGVPGVSIDFTLPDLVDVLAGGPFPVAADKIGALRGRLDAKDAGGVAAIAPAYLPLIEAAGPFEAAHDRLCAFDVGGALRSRLDGLWTIASGLKERVALTLDPTERHGFEYQSWLGFSLFGAGLAGEIGRGGSYAIVREDGTEEPAIGFSLYLDPLVDAGLGGKEARRIFLPLGTDPAAGAALRAQGWRTVAGLAEEDDPQALGCDLVWRNGAAVPIDGESR